MLKRNAFCATLLVTTDLLSLRRPDMRIVLMCLLTVGILSGLADVEPALAEQCQACYTINCQDCSSCKPNLRNVAEGSRIVCGQDESSLRASVATKPVADLPVHVAIVKCSECMGKCATVYSQCRSQCAPNDRACLIQCQELLSQCQQNCQDIHQCE